MKSLKYFFLLILVSVFANSALAKEDDLSAVRIILTKEAGHSSIFSFSAIGNTKAAIVTDYGEGYLRYDTLGLTLKTISDTLRGDSLRIYADSTSFLMFNVYKQGLTSLTFMPTQGLMSLNCAGNAIRLDKLPCISDTTVKYIYAPQRDFKIKSEYILGDTIDFSMFVGLKGIRKENQTTQFIWKNKLGDSLQKGIDYAEFDGKFVFLKEQIDSVYAVFSTEAFPLFKDTNQYRTTCAQINDRLSAPVFQCRLITEANTGDTLCLTFRGRKQEGGFVWIKLSDTNTKVFPIHLSDTTVRYPLEGKIIDISASPNALSEFDCSHNKLIKLDVSAAVSLRKLLCNNNLLDSLRIDKLHYLNELNCSFNKMNFRTLPTKHKHLHTYVYAPQAKLQLGIDSVFLHNPVNLNPYSMVQGITDTLQASRFTWFTKNASLLKKDIDYTEKANVFRFIRTIEEGVYAEMQSTAFPDFKDTNVFRTEIILVKEYSLALKEMISLELTYDTVSDFRFYIRGNMDGLPIEVDFGNGDRVRMFGNTSTTLLTGKRKGENVKIYAAEGALLYFNCFYNKIKKLDVINCESLLALNCSENEISDIDLSYNTLLQELNCSGNQLTNLDLSELVHLKKLACNNNYLMNLGVGSLSTLSDLNCASNYLETLDIGQLLNIEDLRCNDNKLSFIDVDSLSKLRRLVLHNNRFNFATLPARDSLWVQYEYAPQARIELNVSRIEKGDTLDLSYLAFIQTLQGEEIPTEFSWYKLSGGVLIENIDYTMEEGYFIFTKEANDSMYCTMINAAFPRLKGENVLQTDNVYLNIMSDTLPIRIDKPLDAKKNTLVWSVPGGVKVKDAPLGHFISIYNLQGQLVLKERVTNNEKMYPLARGFYIIRVDEQVIKIVVR